MSVAIIIFAHPAPLSDLKEVGDCRTEHVQKGRGGLMNLCIRKCCWITENILASLGIFQLQHLHINIHSRRQGKIRERFNDLGSRVHDVNEALVHAHFKLLPRILEHKR